MRLILNIKNVMITKVYFISAHMWYHRLNDCDGKKKKHLVRLFCDRNEIYLCVISPNYQRPFPLLISIFLFMVNFSFLKVKYHHLLHRVMLILISIDTYARAYLDYTYLINR